MALAACSHTTPALDVPTPSLPAQWPAGHLQPGMPGSSTAAQIPWESFYLDPALRSLIAGGAQLKPFPQDVLEAAHTASNEVYAEISASNADFKTIWESQKAMRSEGYLWFQVAEYAFDSFQIRNRTKG